MTDVEHYESLLAEGPFDTESLTVLVVAGATQQDVATALGIDLAADPTEYPEADDEEFSAYAITDVEGGVLAVEHSGYADPSLDALRALSAGGRSVAVVRDNIQAHVRFGCARDGEVVFDDDEYLFLDDPSPVPAELRPLFDLAWVDPEDEDAEDDADAVAVGLAMAEVVTGLRLTAEDLQRVADSGYRLAPSLVYLPDAD
ncbi:DUF6461 domain-containing protein [Nocardioides lianchengensis]|uniref:Uncharacterized protein n=1 Tax=Nocardioides lianchengensis TaxID=1045774 RepID=A0A1G6L199_9ACTN|nr:DUF6461 domain-containing protein [Nocardioides lianchengensis]SDC36838.1 hypothetical protein SAMN05421872_10275 [Nocardioides lianchengensis]